MKEFFFKLFRLEYEKEECSSCNRLMLLLEEEKRLNKRLLDEILKDNTIIQEISPEAFQPLMPKNTSWAATRSRLEAEDRQRAEEIRRMNSIRELEKELGVKDASEIS